MARYGIQILEEELKNKVVQDWFAAYATTIQKTRRRVNIKDYGREIDNIAEICVTLPKKLNKLYNHVIPFNRPNTKAFV